MRTVLVTAIGSFSADIVIKRLKQYGYRIIGCDIYSKECIVDSYNVNKFYKAPYATNKNEYIEFIKKICVKEKIELIVPLTDIEIDILNINREWFSNNKIMLCISSQETIELCRNKKKIEEFLADKKICKTIDTYFLSKIDVENLKFPVICKPYNGRSSEGVKYIDNKEEMTIFIKKNNIENYIVQPYIEGDIITVDVVRNQLNNKSIAIARKELVRTLNGAGLSVYVFKDIELQNICIKIADSLKINGCVNFEFIEDCRNEKYFVECNPRFSGGIEFSCIAAYDCIINHIKCFEGKNIDSICEFNNMYISRKYEEYITHIED